MLRYDVQNNDVPKGAAAAQTPRLIPGGSRPPSLGGASPKTNEVGDHFGHPQGVQIKALNIRVYFMLRNNDSGPEIGLPGRISARL